MMLKGNGALRFIFLTKVFLNWREWGDNIGLVALSFAGAGNTMARRMLLSACLSGQSVKNIFERMKNDNQN